MFCSYDAASASEPCTALLVSLSKVDNEGTYSWRVAFLVPWVWFTVLVLLTIAVREPQGLARGRARVWFTVLVLLSFTVRKHQGLAWGGAMVWFTLLLLLTLMVRES